ncbi:MAG: BamA/TamA family outer membrane protein [Pseudomonadota bacterium]
MDDNSRLLMPSVGFSRKRADRDINPNRGHSLSLELRGASEALGSTTSFAQFLASARLIRPLGDGGRVLLRVAGGVTFKDALRDLPPDVRFFAGGNESVRGFGYETLGPEDDSGTVVGGSHLLTASIEYDRMLFGNFAWAVFADGGNAFDGTSIDPRYAAGLGLKWRSPIGPVRVYLAHPLNFSNRSVRLHISIGPDL